MIYLLYGEFNLLFALYYVKKNGSALMREFIGKKSSVNNV